MIESQIRALFAEIADSTQAQSQVDVRLARHRGRARLRWRRACIAGTSALAAAAVVATALVVAGPALPGSGQAASEPAAPRQFNPLTPYLTVSWLPAGYKLTAGDTGLRDMALVAQSSGHGFLEVDAYSAGQCKFTGPAGPAGKLQCPGGAPSGFPDSIIGRAPAVGGHSAFWGGRDSTHPSSLVWQYARDGWARLRYSGTIRHPAEAVKIADHVRFGAAMPPLLFPLQLTGLPKTWEVGNVYYQPHGQMLRATRFSLTTGTRHVIADGGLTFQNGIPAFDFIQSASPHQQPCGKANETINGYKVNFYDSGRAGKHVAAPGGESARPSGTGRSPAASDSRLSTPQIHVRPVPPQQGLCVLNDDGLAFSFGMSYSGAHPAIGVISLFTGHIRVLGTNPAHWTTKPIG